MQTIIAQQQHKVNLDLRNFILSHIDKILMDHIVDDVFYDKLSIELLYKLQDRIIDKEDRYG